MSSSVRVLTLNLWGVPFAPRMGDRTDALCRALPSYDVVLLQEVWSDAPEQSIRAAAARLNWFCHGFRSGAVGMGILVLSRYPLRNAMCVPYSAAGNAHMPHHGDYYAGKGVAMCDVILSDSQSLKVFTTHTHACYEKVKGRLAHPEEERYAAVRVAQCLQLAQIITSTSRTCDAILLGGDLNCTPVSVSYRLLVEMTGLRAAFTGDTYTRDNSFNSMPAGYYSLLSMEEDLPAQLDHVMYRGCVSVTKSGAAFTANDAVVLPDGKSCPMSDHYGIEAVIIVGGDTRVARNETPCDPSLLPECQRTVRYGLAKNRTLYKMLLTAALVFVLAGVYFWSWFLPGVGVVVFLVAVTVRGEGRGLEHCEEVLGNLSKSA